MKKALLLLLLPLCCGTQSPAAAAKDQKAPVPKPTAAAPAAPAEKPKLTPEEEAAQKTAARQVEKLAAAIKLARKWYDYVRAGKISEGMDLWGYSAFDGVRREVFAQAVAAQVDFLGKLKSSDILEDRCTVELEGTAPGSAGEGKGVYVTLSCLTGFDKGLRRETIVIFEPGPKKEEVGPQETGMKIIGVRREELPIGKQGAAELAADLGQLALLKLHGAPKERWAPWQREAEALAETLKIKLPVIPDSTSNGEKATGAGEKLAALIMGDLPPLFEKLGAEGGEHEAKALLNAFALLLLYEPGDETCARLAVLSGTEAETAKLPAPLWKPLIRAIREKAKAPAVYEIVQRMSADIAAHLGETAAAETVKDTPKLVLDQALQNMSSIPTCKVRAELSTRDGRKSNMDAALAPGAMYLHLEGFDGKKEARHVTSRGYLISRDGEKTWEDDPNAEEAQGLCRTLQAPLDRTQKFTEKHAYELVGVEKFDGEQLFRFESDDLDAPVYWVLMSKNGPVIRRASMKMKFGDLETMVKIVYTKLGKEVEIPQLGLLPPAKLDEPEQ